MINLLFPLHFQRVLALIFRCFYFCFWNLQWKLNVMKKPILFLLFLLDRIWIKISLVTETTTKISSISRCWLLSQTEILLFFECFVILFYLFCFKFEGLAKKGIRSNMWSMISSNFCLLFFNLFHALTFIAFYILACMDLRF